MDPREPLRFLIEGSCNLVREAASELSDAEWDSRAAPGTSKLGFTVWHSARIVDWAVTRAARGVAEVAESETWRGRFPAAALAGFGIPDHVADGIPSAAGRELVLRYVDDVRAAARAFLDGLSEADLETPVRLRANLAGTDYLRPEVWAEIESLEGVRLWQLLVRPPASHVRVHMGEVQALRPLLRGPVATA